MLWVEHSDTKYIPRKLCYDGWQRDKNEDGYTPLMLCVKFNHKYIPKLLLEGFEIV